ncbi:two-pore potassium channel 3-like [Trifolium medium]|uniref:Two-pore potassium channel 3-like n=1 Tax=Trifolium medium TaxID=97028 RepID=A0A392NHE3_9FABA|nr:two-pore potassium channel 3-like [Trifolium medium]
MIALVIIFTSIISGTVMSHILEHTTWIDSFYLSISSVTTVGYGDYSFKTVAGRTLAIVWLLISTICVKKSCLYLADYCQQQRRRIKEAKQIPPQTSPAVAVALSDKFNLLKYRSIGKKDDVNIKE